VKPHAIDCRPLVNVSHPIRDPRFAALNRYLSCLTPFFQIILALDIKKARLEAGLFI
jgi:hypothetical protein